MSALRIADKHGNEWQYHSQSDAHSKITCWSILFDLLLNCRPLRNAIEAGSVGFGINHQMHDFETRRTKNLDLVVCTAGAGAPKKRKKNRHGPPVSTFVDLAEAYSVILSDAERDRLAWLPTFPVVAVGSVYIALEAKATMTEHIKALPRLHDELDSSHSTVHGHADHAIAAALVTINFASEFVSPKRNTFDLATQPPHVTKHSQPKVTERTIAKVQELRRRSVAGQAGFDAVGIVIVNFRNDGSPCQILTEPPAPAPSDPFHYEQMIRRIAALYQAKFPGL